MKQGTGRTVLVRDLFGSDGPYVEAARDFATGTCTLCGVAVSEQDARFHELGYLCHDCWQAAARGVQRVGTGESQG